MPRQRRPRTEVVPAEVAVRTDDVLRVLHDGVIDGDLFQPGIVPGQGGVELGQAADAPPFIGGGEQLGLQSPQLAGDGSV